MPSHFHSARQSAGLHAGDVRRLQRMRQHRRTEHRRLRRVRPRRALLQPCEQRQIRRRQAVPHLLHIIGLDAADLRQRDLRQPRRDADAQSARDQFEKCQPRRCIARIQPARDDTRQRRLGRALQCLHHLGQTRRRRIGGGGRPHQRDGLGQIADIVVRPREQHRIGARRGKFADQARLGGGERKLAGDRRQTDAAVRVRLRCEIPPQQRDLRVARRREHQALQQFGEGDHGDPMLARHAHYANVARTCAGCYGDIDAPPPLPRVSLATTLLLAVLGGCDTTQYKNPSHPGYGDAEYKSDLAQCRKQNSKVVIRGATTTSRRSRWTKTRRGPA